jgi:DNA polymerase-3 subunit gamma/tau
MDTDLSGVLDRIRQLEQKLESGAFVQQVPPQGAAFAAGQASPVPASAVPAVKPEKAAPEDLVKIRSMWRKIVGMCGQPLRSYLDKAVPSYDSNSGGQKLYVYLKNEVAAEQVKLPEHMEELCRVIVSLTGKEAQIEVVTDSSGNPGSLSEIPLEDVLEDQIQGLPVEEFDGPEEEF